MKYLIWGVLLALAWFWRRRSKRASSPPAAGTTASSEPQAMIQCPVCGFHLPRSEAFVGRVGAYCSEDHRARHEQ